MSPVFLVPVVHFGSVASFLGSMASSQGPAASFQGSVAFFLGHITPPFFCRKNTRLVCGCYFWLLFRVPIERIPASPRLLFRVGP